jgi:hypothetical protein
MDYTYATLIVIAEDQQAAKDLLSQDYFNMGLSADGNPPATHYVTAGPFSNEELNTAMNQTAVPFWVHFGMEPDYNGMVPAVEHATEVV